MKRLLKSIDGFYKSYALIPQDADHANAIVFVHGFGGSPTGTWSDFQGLSEEYADTYPWWKTATLFFYSYNSKWEPIHLNAVRLRDFLKSVLSTSPEKKSTLRNRTVKDKSTVPVDWNYKKLLLVGHSEGAVVIRRMILNRIEILAKSGHKRGLEGSELRKWVETNAKKDLILRAHLKLFASACGGTNLSGVWGFVHGFIRYFAALASSSVVRNELLKGSPILDGLQKGTQLAYEKYSKIDALEAEILFGTEDQIVYTDKYECDEIVEPYAEGHDHFSVCRPKYIYTRPLEFVKL